MGEDPDSESGTVGVRAPRDLALELTRQHNLLTMMVGRMNEAAAGLERGAVKSADRIDRALEVHQRFLIRVHYACEDLVLDALRSSRRALVRAHVKACRDAHPESELFQRKARALLQEGPLIASAQARGLAALFRREADRIETHLAKEDELYRQLDQILPDTVRRRILRAIRRFDEDRVVAEIDLISWASQIHPSAD